MSKAVIKNKGNSLAETKKINRILIKNIIFRNDNITRNDISLLLELTLPTITTNINEMMAEGMLEEIPFQSSGYKTAGRKPSAISFRADLAYAIGVELGPYATHIVMIDMKGNIIAEREGERAKDDYSKMLQSLSEQISSFILPGRRILGIGIGLPGFIESSTGVIRSNLREGWTGRHLSEDLQRIVGYPVLIDNNVRLRALGYDMSVKNSGFDTFAYFYMSKGIACPLIMKNDMVSGFTAGAGEIGQNILAVEGGQKKTLDDLGSEKAILEACRSMNDQGRLLSGEEDLTDWDICDVLRYQAKDEEVERIVSNAIEYMGLGLSHVVNLMNPGLVVVDSHLFSREENREKFKIAARKHFYGLNEDEVSIAFVPYEASRGAKGAAYHIIKEFLLESEI